MWLDKSSINSKRRKQERKEIEKKEEAVQVGKRKESSQYQKATLLVKLYPHSNLNQPGYTTTLMLHLLLRGLNMIRLMMQLDKLRLRIREKRMILNRINLLSIQISIDYISEIILV